jgi:hypothetical protein
VWAHRIHTLLQTHDQVVINCNHGRTRTPIVATPYVWLYQKHGFESIADLAEAVKNAIQDDRPTCGLVLGQDGNKMVNVLDRAVIGGSKGDGKRARWATG